MGSQYSLRAAIGFVAIAFFGTMVSGQCTPPGGEKGGNGPDVIVGVITTPNSYGSPSGSPYYSYSIGTTSCNIGTALLSWIAGTNDHPVISQNMFRHHNGRFEQIGMSWLKHGFAALQGNSCSCGCAPGSGSALGLGCSDPYGAGLNGSQGSLGTRLEVTAPHEGLFTYPQIADPSNTDSTWRRLRVHGNDLSATLYPGADYLVEAQYVTKDDALAGNAYNNCSYRGVDVTPGSLSITYNQPTQRQRTCIQAWADLDPNVILKTIPTGEAPVQGRMVLGTLVTNNFDGTWTYEYALYNQNSTRGCREFEVPFPTGATITGVGFHDVEYHSTDPIVGTDWPGVVGTDNLNWATDTEAVDPNANAIRWGTLYNFRFTADYPPAPVTMQIGYFRQTGFTGTGTTVVAMGPADIPAPVQNLTCAPSPGTATLAWSVPDTYDSIEVKRNNVLLATLPGTDTGFIDSAAPDGSWNYSVQTFRNGAESSISICNVQIVTPPLLYEFQAETKTVTYNETSGAGTFSVTYSLEEMSSNFGFPNDTAGVSMAVANDPQLLTPTSVDPSPLLEAMQLGLGPQFYVPYTFPNGFAVGILFDLDFIEFLSAPTPQPIIDVTYATNAANLAGDTDGELTNLTFTNGTLGNPVIDNIVTTDIGNALQPLFVNGQLDLQPTIGTEFRRGDCNDDSSINIADPVWLLGLLFPSGAANVLACDDACDANDDEVLNIADAVRILNALFGPTVPLPAPYPGCGLDAAGTNLACGSYGTCP
ncbi:MAG: hypothetical protein AAF581_08280 [Planctomycetota bacterium]